MNKPVKNCQIMSDRNARIVYRLYNAVGAIAFGCVAVSCFLLAVYYGKQAELDHNNQLTFIAGSIGFFMPIAAISGLATILFVGRFIKGDTDY